jgi:hypothetical protein
MSLVGSVSLTNNENGLYLGKVNIDNLNVSADQLLYSTDGVNISGLNLGNGLEKVIDDLKTIGNPDIQLTTASKYVNAGISTIQSAVDSATAPDTIYISSGSYNETVNITNKTNIALINNSANISTICEILNGLNITGTSENIRLSNLSIKGASCNLSGVGRNVYSNCVFTGTVSTPLNITIGDGTSQYMTFSNCGFNEYCNITVPVTFTNVIYFIDCNWGGASLTLNQTLATQVIINNTANLVSFPVKATYVGMNVLTSGLSNLTTTNINGATALSVANQADNRVITATATTNSLTAESNLTFNGNARLGIDTIYIHTTSGGGATEVIQMNETAAVVGAKNVAIGHKCVASNSCVTLGCEVGKTGMSGTYNVLIGRSCAEALTTGNGSVLIGGNNSLAMTTGTNNTIVGTSSGTNQTTQSNNTICGYFSNCRDGAGTTYSNCSVLGANIKNGVISGNNQVQLGDSATTTYAYGAVQDRSDARDKADIKNTSLGLEFIEKLRPVDFRWDYREDYKVDVIDENQNITTTILDKDGSKKRNRFHHGLIAQEVKQVMTDLNIDFGGYQDHSYKGGFDRLTIGYEELIAPMIKAIQQLSERVKQLESK